MNLFWLLNGIVWGIVAGICGFSVRKDWQAWLIIVCGVVMVDLARTLP